MIVIKKNPEWVLNYKKKLKNEKTGQTKWINNYYYRREENITDCEKYFAKNIFAGEYLDLERNTKVVFNDLLGVSGINSATTYSVSLGKWEYSDKLDIITLKMQYYWKFIGDTLLLTEAFPNEDNARPAGFKLGKLKYRLLKEK